MWENSTLMKLTGKYADWRSQRLLKKWLSFNSKKKNMHSSKWNTLAVYLSSRKYYLELYQEGSLDAIRSEGYYRKVYSEKEKGLSSSDVQYYYSIIYEKLRTSFSYHDFLKFTRNWNQINSEHQYQIVKKHCQCEDYEFDEETMIEIFSSMMTYLNRIIGED